jgi:Nuclease-related domain
MYLETLFHEMHRKNKKYRFLVYKNRYFIQLIKIIQLLLYLMIMTSIFMPLLIVYKLANSNPKIELILFTLLLLSYSIYKTIRIHSKHTKRWLHDFQLKKTNITHQLNLLTNKTRRLSNDILDIKQQIQLKQVGNQLEDDVALILTSIKKGFCIQNVIIETDDGITEIDALLIHPTGIHVFECKNYSGKLIGKSTEQDWIQYVGKQKKVHFNPYYQNNGHIKYLRNYLYNKLKINTNIPITSHIIFNDHLDFHQVGRLDGHSITTLSALQQQLNHKLNDLPTILSWKERKKLNALLTICQSNDALEKKHLSQFLNGKYDYLNDL